MDILTTKGLTKTYQTGAVDVHAVLNANVAFEKGSFMAITGPSGSGKSTLLHMLGGLEYPTSGQVIYQDKDLYAYNDNQLSVLRRRRFGFVFQAYNLVKELTGYENMLLPIMLDKKEPDQAYIKHIIDMLGIESRLDHLPSAMSGGEQQRMSIARALANKPDIVFADEPTGNLDGKTGQEVIDLLRFVNRSLGVTMILVTHDRSIASQAQRILTLEDGTIISDTAMEV